MDPAPSGGLFSDRDEAEEELPLETGDAANVPNPKTILKRMGNDQSRPRNTWVVAHSAPPSPAVPRQPPFVLVNRGIPN